MIFKPFFHFSEACTFVYTSYLCDSEILDMESEWEKYTWAYNIFSSIHICIGELWIPIKNDVCRVEHLHIT